MQQLRDNKGRFIKQPELLKTRPAKDHYRSDPVPNPFADYYDDEEPIKIAPLVKASLALSNNWSTVVAYVVYALLCFGFGMIGGLLGTQLGLR